MDFSEASYIALKYAISMAKVQNACIHIVHVIDQEKKIGEEDWDSVTQIIERERKSVTILQSSLCEMIHTEGIETKSLVEFGNLILIIKKHIGEISPDLIFVGKKEGKNKKDSRLLKYLLDDYSGGILITQKETQFSESSQILVGCSERTLKCCNTDLVMDLGKVTNTTLEVFHVQKSNLSKKTNHLSNEWLKFDENRLSINFTSIIDNKVLNGITSFIDKTKSDLICLGRGKRKKSFWESVFDSSGYLDKIVDQVHIPILVMATESDGVKGI